MEQKNAIPWNIRGAIVNRRQTRKKLLMVLAGGDMVQYNELRGMPIEDFLIKVDQHTARLKREVEHQQEMERQQQRQLNK